MRIFKKLKKGFTLVELVVVIAVVAILAAVSVVSYIGVTNNAKKSNDLQILNQVNSALALREELTGKKPETMHDALIGLREDLGISEVERLLQTSYSKYDFAWDIDANRFVLLNDDKISESPADYNKETTKGTEYKFWKIVDNATNDTVYSQYLSSSSTQEEIVVKAGVDVGYCDFVQNISYQNNESQKEVVIRTNSYTTELSIDGFVNSDGTGDTIKHFDILGNLNIKKVAMHSYDEFGRVGGTCLLSEGHIVVGDGGEITSIAVNNSDTSKVDIETEDSGVVGVVMVISEQVANDMSNENNDGVNEWVYDYCDENGDPITDIEEIIEKINDIATKSMVFIKETNIYYEDMREAINACEPGQTIVLVRDTYVEYAGSYISILKDDDIRFDLNGHILTSSTETPVASDLIVNRGKLTIVDRTDKEGDGSSSGLITTESLGADRKGVPGYASNTITNLGNLIIESGTIVNSSLKGSAAFAIDNSVNEGDVELTINGGKVLSGESYSIRLASFMGASKNTVDIKNAYIDRIWFQDTNATNKGDLTIENSTIGSIKFGYLGVATNTKLVLKNSTVTKLFSYQLDASISTNIIEIDNSIITGFYMETKNKVLTSGTFIISEEEVSIGWVGTDSSLTKEEADQLRAEYLEQGIRTEEAGYSTWWQGYLNSTGQLYWLKDCVAEGFELRKLTNNTYTIVRS